MLEDELVPLDFSIRNWMMISVYAPAVGKTVAFKLMDAANPDNSMILEATTTKAAEWDTLIFDFSGAEAGVYNKISIHPDFGGTTAGEEWYFNLIKKTRDLVGYSDGVLFNFEDKVNYFFYWDCGDPQEAEFLVVENPDPSGIDTSQYVGLFFTSSGCTWEGTATAEKFIPFNFEDAWLFKLKVYAPEAGRNFMFKVEKYENYADQPIETTVTVDSAGVWEELEFDLSGAQSGFYTRVALFPDFGANDGMSDEWFFDDLRLVNPNDTQVDADKVVKVFQLAAANYPNPFNPTTTIAYSVPTPSQVKVTVYDVNGRELQTLVNERHSRGDYRIQFDASNLPSGVYFYKVATDYDAIVHKMALMR